LGAIAHDINNLLTAILGHAELALGESELSAETRADIREISRAAQRAALLARQLVTLRRTVSANAVTLDLNAVVGSMGTMLRPLLGEAIELRVALGPRPVRVMADPAEIELVILNLALNARDAMPAGGLLTLAVEAAPAGRQDRVRRPTLTVSDTGLGMDESTRLRAFEPFYTTKGSGRGSGLGLSSVATVVERSGWTLSFESEPSRGTRFVITLPSAEPAEPAVDGEVTVPPALELHGTERIVVIETDTEVQAIVGRILRSLGYAVVEAAGPADAAALATEESAPVDLVIADLDPAAIQVRAAAFGVIAEHPGARLVLIAGTGADRGRPGDPPTATIAKPFTPDELARTVRALLDGPPARSADRPGVVLGAGVRT
jgi:CheY-like chemotaxis protein/two-component sensor histidine kinase